MTRRAATRAMSMRASGAARAVFRTCILMLAVIASVWLPSTEHASATVTTLTPEADAFVNRNQASTNRGALAELRIRTGVKETYLRFNASGLPAGEVVTTATLRLYATAASPCSLGAEALRAASDTWAERTITWSNRPGVVGEALGGAAAWQSSGYVSFDVSSALSGRGLVSFVVRTPAGCTATTDSLFNSREASANKPQLVVETGPAPIPSATPTPSGSFSPPGPTPSETIAPTPTSSVPGPPGDGITIAAAGDIACAPNDTTDPCRDADTAALITDDPAIQYVFALGDNQYENGTLADYLAVYDNSWGAFKAKTKPSVGNHEYQTANAQGYRDYFTTGAGPLYYSFTVGSWHVVALDSNCNKLPAGSAAHGCGKGSPQESWLAADLAADSSACTLAFWHHPKFSSDDPQGKVLPLFTDLYNDGAEFVLSGHAHSYERFAPQTPQGVRDDVSGVTQFVVGTGGKNHRVFDLAPPNSLVKNDSSFGVLKMKLGTTGYMWQFVSTDGSFTDSGSGTCHAAPGAARVSTRVLRGGP